MVISILGTLIQYYKTFKIVSNFKRFLSKELIIIFFLTQSFFSSTKSNMAESQQRILVARHFLLSSPPGQIAEVEKGMSYVCLFRGLNLWFVSRYFDGVCIKFKQQKCPSSTTSRFLIFFILILLIFFEKFTIITFILTLCPPHVIHHTQLPTHTQMCLCSWHPPLS